MLGRELVRAWTIDRAGTEVVERGTVLEVGGLGRPRSDALGSERSMGTRSDHGVAIVIEKSAASSEAGRGSAH
jgi:hypothetical protein